MDCILLWTVCFGAEAVWTLATLTFEILDFDSLACDLLDQDNALSLLALDWNLLDCGAFGLVQLGLRPVGLIPFVLELTFSHLFLSNV